MSRQNGSKNPRRRENRQTRRTDRATLRLKGSDTEVEDLSSAPLSLKNRSGRNRSNYDDQGNGLKVKIEAQTPKQGLMLSHIKSADIVIAVGPPGTGKTAVATLEASRRLYEKECDQIILTRPIVEIGKSIGFLPGDESEKYAPYLVPFIEHLNSAFTPGGVEMLIKAGKIRPLAINFIQGHTWNNAIVLIDEAQNMTKQEMFMLLTRIGKNSKVIITGDEKQAATESLLRDNGLSDLIQKVKNERNGVTFNKGELGFVQFTEEDNVRSGLSKKITKLYA